MLTNNKLFDCLFNNLTIGQIGQTCFCYFLSGVCCLNSQVSVRVSGTIMVIGSGVTIRWLSLGCVGILTFPVTKMRTPIPFCRMMLKLTCLNLSVWIQHLLLQRVTYKKNKVLQRLIHPIQNTLMLVHMSMNRVKSCWKLFVTNMAQVRPLRLVVVHHQVQLVLPDPWTHSGRLEHCSLDSLYSLFTNTWNRFTLHVYIYIYILYIYHIYIYHICLNLFYCDRWLCRINMYMDMDNVWT